MSGRADYLGLGDWNAVCSMCGRKRKASTLVKNWQGMWRCPEHNEERHPQDFVRGVPDIQTPAWTQPMPADTFVAVCGPNDQSAIPDQAVPGCVTPDYLAPGNTIFIPEN
jgi:hypothetical protein